MKETKVIRTYIKSETVVCPYCNGEQDPCEEFGIIANEDDFEIVQNCVYCHRGFILNWIKEV